MWQLKPPKRCPSVHPRNNREKTWKGPNTHEKIIETGTRINLRRERKRQQQTWGKEIHNLSCRKSPYSNFSSVTAIFTPRIAIIIETRTSHSCASHTHTTRVWKLYTHLSLSLFFNSFLTHLFFFFFTSFLFSLIRLAPAHYYIRT